MLMLFIFLRRMHDSLALTADAAVDTLGTAATVCSVAVLTAACRGGSYLVISVTGGHHLDIVRM